VGKEREGVKWEKGEVGEENGERTGRVREMGMHEQIAPKPVAAIYA